MNTYKLTSWEILLLETALCAYLRIELTTSPDARYLSSLLDRSKHITLTLRNDTQQGDDCE